MNAPHKGTVTQSKHGIGTATITHLPCVQGPKADRLCTPGREFHPVSRADVCSPGWATDHRNVSYSTKLLVYKAYGIFHHVSGSYEVDHLIPLELGGNNEIQNLWPERQPGARAKDEVEDTLHNEVCSGNMTLRHAWSVIRREYVR